ncbi:hypothetical protein BLOT_000286 [Blomia tropicalis]|nr:hypothetical protein BLOT_000286 [Blomia tropicalis]
MTRRSICNWVQSIRNVQYAHHATSLTDSFSMCVCMSTRSIWGHEFKCPLDMMPFDTNRSMPIDCLLFHSLPLLMGLNRSGTRHIIGKLWPTIEHYSHKVAITPKWIDLNRTAATNLFLNSVQLN